MRYIVFLLISLSLSSCQDLKKEGQLEAITHLEQEVDSIHRLYLAHKNDSIEQIMVAVRDVELRIRSGYRSDTIGRDLGEKLNAYKTVRKKLQPIGRLYAQLDLAAREERKALKRLKHDIERAAGDKGKYDEHIWFERKKTTELKQTLSNMMAELRQCFETYALLHDEMYNYSLSLSVN
jgi:hypothetical protein